MENTKDNTDLNKNSSDEENVTENNVTDAPVETTEATSASEAVETAPGSEVSSATEPEAVTETTPPPEPVESTTESVGEPASPEVPSETTSDTESPSETVPVTVVPSEAPAVSSSETTEATPAATDVAAPEASEAQFTPTVLNAAPTEADDQPANSSVLSIANDAPHAPGVKKGLPAMLISLLVLVLGIGLGFVAAGATGFSLTDSGDNKKAEIKAPVVVDKELTVPTDATIIAECAIGRGKQYVLPKDIPQGPVYNVWNGKVIGIEYMLGQKDVAANKDFLNLPLENVKYDHINIGLLSKGHSGFTDPHYHVDVFTISHEEASKITCQ